MLILQSDGTLLATGSYDGFARIWTEDGKTEEIIYPDFFGDPKLVSVFKLFKTLILFLNSSQEILQAP